jgi:hypothetical protein
MVTMVTPWILFIYVPFVTKLFTPGNHGNYGNEVVLGKNDLRALLALGIKDLWTSFELMMNLQILGEQR